MTRSLLGGNDPWRTQEAIRRGTEYSSDQLKTLSDARLNTIITEHKINVSTGAARSVKEAAILSHFGDVGGRV